MSRIFISLIRQKREEFGYTQYNLGEALGVSQSYISRWELSKTYPKYPELKKLSELFNCNIEDLYEEKPGKHS